MKKIIYLIQLLFFSFLFLQCENKSNQDKALDQETNDQRFEEVMAENKAARDAAQKMKFSDSDFLKTKQPMSLDAIAPCDHKTGLVGDKAYNARVYIAALERAKKKLVIDNNTLTLTIKSGAEINIAEDLYQFIVWVIGTWNDWVKEGTMKIIKTDEGYYDISAV